MLSARNNRYSLRAAGVARGAAVSSLGKRKADEFSPPSTPHATAAVAGRWFKFPSLNAGDMMDLGVSGSFHPGLTAYLDHKKLDPQTFGEMICLSPTELEYQFYRSLPSCREELTRKLQGYCDDKANLDDDLEVLKKELEDLLAKLGEVNEKINQKKEVRDYCTETINGINLSMKHLDQKLAVAQYACSTSCNKAYSVMSFDDIRDDIQVQTQEIAKELSGQEALGKLHTLKNMGLHGRKHRDVKIEVPTGTATAEVHIANLIKVLEIPAEENKDEAMLALLKQQTEELMAKMSAKKSAKKARLL